MVKSDLLTQYDRDAAAYGAFCDKLRTLIIDLLEARALSVHSVTSRTKTRESLERKIAGAEAKYTQLGNITDVAGIRIITYFADHVDAVAELIRHEFTVDEQNSIDKRGTLDPDRFGYLSLHYIVSLASTRVQLLEFKRFANLKAEIQIRSILQHAWAEIEHDLGYKTAAGVPRDVRRQFSRLAGLLEIADDEFTVIRTKLQAYETRVAAQIQSAPETVLIDKASLKILIESSEVLATIERRVAELTETELAEPSDDFLERCVERLASQGIATVAEAESALHNYAAELVDFAVAAVRGIRKSGGGKIYKGVVVLHLGFWVMFEANGAERFREYVSAITDDEDEVNRAVEVFVESYRSAKARTEISGTA